MSFLKLALQIAFWYAAATIVPQLLTPFVGEQNAHIIYWVFLAIYIGGAYILGKIVAKQGHKLTKILPVSDDIPDSVREVTDELELFGFTPMGVMQRKPAGGLFGNHVAYVYSNKSRNIIAYAVKKGDIKLTLSCSFPDGFDVSTDYPKGLPSETQKVIRRVIKSSVRSALDFHKHHVKKHIAAHGKPKQFSNLRELFDWEDQHELTADSYQTMNKHSNKLWIRAIAGMIIAPFIAMIVLVPIMVYFIFTTNAEALAIMNWISSIAITVSIFIGLLWAYRPLYKPETVEERKKKEFA